MAIISCCLRSQIVLRLSRLCVFYRGLPLVKKDDLPTNFDCSKWAQAMSRSERPQDINVLKRLILVRYVYQRLLYTRAIEFAKVFN